MLKLNVFGLDIGIPRSTAAAQSNKQESEKVSGGIDCQTVFPKTMVVDGRWLVRAPDELFNELCHALNSVIVSWNGKAQAG